MRRAALLFLPLLALYLALVLHDRVEHLTKDEPTYLALEASLRTGRCTVAGTEFFWAGPGYPIVIAIGRTLGLSLGALKLGNAVFLYLAVLLLFGTLVRSVSRRRAFCIALLFGLYWPAFEELGFLMTEPFATFLVALVLFAGSGFLRGSLWWVLLAAPALAMLALTKIAFGYALAAMLLIGIAWSVIASARVAWRGTLLMAAALLLCVPYLTCTHAVTGRYFLWGTSGGMQFYFMTSPHEGERGDWINYVHAGRHDPTEANPVIRNHGAVFQRALRYRGRFEDEPYLALIRRLGVHQHDVFVRAGWQNLLDHPAAYARNWLANVGRLILGGPFSHGRPPPGAFEYAVPNLLLLAAVLLALLRAGASLAGHRLAVLVFVGVYLGGVSLVACYPRFFSIMAPMLFWLAGSGNRAGRTRDLEASSPVATRSLVPTADLR